MVTKSSEISKFDFDDEINTITSLFSDSDQEKISGRLLAFLQKTSLLKILDEKKGSGPGTLREVLNICQILGKTDASLGWLVGVSNSAWSMRSSFNSLEILDSAISRNHMLAMVLGRPGILKKNHASDHYILSGEWRYASGWPYCSVFFGLATIEEMKTSNVQVVAIPSEKLELVEDWKAIGLRGTQSVTIRAKNIEIPKCQVQNFASICSGENITSTRLINNENKASYSRFFTGVLMNCLVGSILGATESGLEYVIKISNERPIGGSTYTSMSHSGAVRTEIGKLRSHLDLYKRAAEYNADVIDNVARKNSGSLSIQERVDNRARATMIMRGCVNIVQDLLWIYGSSGLDKGNPLEKIWRDVNVGARHGGFSKFIPEEAVGLACIGHDPKALTMMF